jgi:hypothetical protein
MKYDIAEIITKVSVTRDKFKSTYETLDTLLDVLTDDEFWQTLYNDKKPIITDKDYD